LDQQQLSFWWPVYSLPCCFMFWDQQGKLILERLD